MADSAPREVLVLCTGNSARSIMAEFIINHELAGLWHASSAGVEPSSPKPHALRALEEIGVPHEGARSQSVEEFLHRDDLDLVITVCDHARETCPVFLRPVEQVHIGLEDPALFIEKGDEVAMEKFREVREAIREQVVLFLRERGEAGGEPAEG
jgi:arsenate reductase